MLAFSVLQADIFAAGGPRLTADFNAAVKTSTVAVTDVLIDGSPTATAVNVVDGDTIEFLLPALSAGTHTVAFPAGSIQDMANVGLDAFSRSFNVAAAAQYAMKHSVRLQPGNAPLTGYAGSDLDRVDLLWQTVPGGGGTQDSFQVEYRATNSVGPWQGIGLNAVVDTLVENRRIWSASITGLNWNTDYTYRVRHFGGDVILDQYQQSFHTRLPSGDSSPFSFAAYGDSADAAAAAAGFRAVQGRINQINPAFSVLLGDNVYDAGTHQQSDARFDPYVNPEAAAWMAGHIDYLGLGNHDVATGSGQPSEQNYSVPVPVAGVTAPAAPPGTELPEHNFSWDYGNVHFITFDTNSLSDAARLDGLLKWVVADLQASTARWKIVYGHHPLAGVPDKPESPGDNYYQQVVNRLKAAGVDLFMTGHSHTYSWTYPLVGQVNGVATFEDSDDHDHFLAGVGLPQLVSGLGGRDIRTGTFTQFPFVAAGYTASTPVAARLGFSKVDVTPSQLTISYVAADNGAVLDSFVITKEDNRLTQSFQQGTNGYSGAVDTFLHQNAPSIANGSAASLKVDGDDPATTGLTAQALLRFDNIFGSGPGQIPANSTIRSATLQLQTTNGGNSMNLHRLLGTWSAADTWNSATFHTNGVQPDGIEAVINPDTSSGFSQIGVVSFNVLDSLRVWKSNPATNFGWALLPTGGDGVDFNSSEGASRPKLIVTYVLDAAKPLSAGYSAAAPAWWQANEQKTFVVTLTNTGTQTWNAGGSNPVHLGVYFSAVNTTSNDALSEPSRFVLPADLAPGASVSISVTAQAPALNSGATSLRLRMVKEGVAWFQDFLLTNIYFPTGQPLSASYAAAVPTLWQANEQKTFSATLTNTGTTTWSAGGANPVHLGVYFSAVNATSNDALAEPSRVNLPVDIAPGASVTVNVTMQSPAANSGATSLRLRMVKEGVAWFQDLSTTSFYFATGRPLSATYAAAVPAVWQSNEQKTFLVTVTNTGTTSWTAGGANPVHLGVYFSAVNTTSNDALSEPARFILPADLAPGASATVSVTITAPAASSGAASLRLRMVKEGVAWFQDLSTTNIYFATGRSLSAAYAAAVPTVWQANEQKIFSATVTNTGTTTWSAGGANPVHLGAYFSAVNATSNDALSEPLRFILPADLAPGASVTVSVTMRAPVAGSGATSLRLRMVKEGVAWFQDLKSVAVTVG